MSVLTTKAHAVHRRVVGFELVYEQDLDQVANFGPQRRALCSCLRVNTSLHKRPFVARTLPWWLLGVLREGAVGVATVQRLLPFRSVLSSTGILRTRRDV